MELLLSMTATHWLIAGLLLLTLELIGSGGYLLWIGGAAISTSVLARLSSVSVENQWFVFGCLSLLFTFCWYLYQRGRDKRGLERTGLNQRSRGLIGALGTTLTSVSAQSGRVKIGDTSWSARCVEQQEVQAGEQVEVIEVDGTVLVVSAVSEPDS
ncbi:NfeD family protein [Ferrimonas kyonanensis]|uniref:NfeD family protein n=1 Tax=Ferrimonas kyonanensis TaxID=364763 RepID=UPI0006855F38|nr:NfeD family protein [Ferrimonas kyonanensis]